MSIRKCPHCKSKKGFAIIIGLQGYQYEEYNFNGKLLNVDRQGADTPEKYVTCLNCNKTISTESVKIN